MGRDQRHLRHVVILAEEISIHSPRMGRDAPSKSPVNAANEFQSTLPAWGETLSDSRFPCFPSISIHSPRMGRDGPDRGLYGPILHFNPLSPHGERQGLPSARMVLRISIHSPRMGRDLVYCKYTASMANFNPLSPHGERLLNAVHQLSLSVISIHSPRMGRDAPPPPSRSSATISIHSPRMGRDQSCRQSGYAEAISIHSPRMGRDCECVLLVPRGADISIHSPRMGRDGQGGGDDRPGSDFNPLSPHGERPLYSFGNRKCAV